MKRSSFLIRFIDVGLIMLFGFIMISDINLRSQIPLPSSGDGSESEIIQTLIIISIYRDGSYEITEAETEIRYGLLQSIMDLEKTLREVQKEKRSGGVEVVALISPDEKATMQNLVDVLDVCDKLRIAKNINIPSFRL